MTLMAEAKDDNIHAEEHNPGSAQDLSCVRCQIEYQAKCRALAPTISATYVGKYATVSV